MRAKASLPLKLTTVLVKSVTAKIFVLALGWEITYTSSFSRVPLNIKEEEGVVEPLE